MRSNLRDAESRNARWPPFSTNHVNPYRAEGEDMSLPRTATEFTIAAAVAVKRLAINRLMLVGAGALVVTAALTLTGKTPLAVAQEPAPPPTKALEGPSARFEWSMPDRYQRGWQAWNETEERYDGSYVRPRYWSVVVDACGSSGNGDAITEYDLTITGVGFSFRTNRRSSRCLQRFDNLDRLGEYDVTLKVRTARAASQPRTERIELRDYLVVSIGDSMASGEGVPDTPGLYTFGSTLPQTAGTLTRLFNGDIRLHTERAAEWKNRRCHRSARGGHALTASALERRDSKSSVTFVSLACSGAEIGHLIDKNYEGRQPLPRSGTVPPQLEVLKGLVGAGSGSRGRLIDALLLASGVNELGLADIVQACALNWNTVHGNGDPDCVYDSGASVKLTPGGTVDQSFGKLAEKLDSLDVADVYITDYPGAPFGESRGGCGLLGLPGIGIESREAQAMAGVGLQLYWATGRAAVANGWNWVPGMSNAFAGHDYCASDPYLVSLEASLLRQGTIFGAVHPNTIGHAKLANLLLDAIVFRPQLPHWHARLVVQDVRVEPDFHGPTLRRADQTGPGAEETGQPPPPPPPSDRYSFDFELRTIPNWPAGIGHRFTIPKTSTGQWIKVPAELGTFEVDLYDPPRPPRYPTSVDFLTYGPGGTLPGYYTAAQSYGSGCHELSHATGWSIRYRVEVTRVDGRPHGPATALPPCQQTKK
jgi:hypothetical protein